jgi:hypothetical protein
MCLTSESKTPRAPSRSSSMYVSIQYSYKTPTSFEASDSDDGAVTLHSVTRELDTRRNLGQSIGLSRSRTYSSRYNENNLGDDPKF